MVEWKKGQEVLKASKKYKMSQDGAVAKLIIHDLDEEDAGDYSCVCEDQQTTATLTVNGKTNKQAVFCILLVSLSLTEKTRL